MLRNVFQAVALAVFSASFAVPAEAYDAQCDEIKNPNRRALCQCRSDAGATVSRRPNAEGRLIVRETKVKSRNLPLVHACMEKKGFKAPA